MPWERSRKQNLCACGCGKLAPIIFRKSGKRKGHVQRYATFIPGHGNKDRGQRMRLRAPGASDRLPIGSTRVHFSAPHLAYRQIKVGPGRKGWRFEHRVVMEWHLGRVLLRSEHVHHKNHDTLNNAIENLELMTHPQHNTVHHSLHGRWSKGFAKCKECGTTERKYEGRGLCSACYQRRRYSAGLTSRQRIG